MEKFPARIHVLIARKADSAVVIRRGPSGKVCTIGWDMKKNKFTVGQWLNGRIYERRSDLSPDGRYMIYFAMNGKWDSKTKGSWTAISKAPYLKAIGLWGKGDCWNGGGLFVSDSQYWINHGYGHFLLQNPRGLNEVSEVNLEYSKGNECLGVYFPRLVRDGWKFLKHARGVSYFGKYIDAPWLLKKTVRATINPPVGKACYYDEHELYNIHTKQVLKFPDWEWADFRKGILYWADKGKLYKGTTDEEGLATVKELYDFNDMIFERLKAPY
jgi:hypothetical protein